jgi:iron complex outermembrane receptor protein
MSELINNWDDRATVRWKLLVSVSALVLTAVISSPRAACAEDTDRPFVWIELGGQYSLLDDGQERYAPPFLPLLPASLPSPLTAQKLPGGSLDWNGKISFEPDGSDWVFSAGITYGRSSSTGRVEKVLPPTQVDTYLFANGADYVQSEAHEDETHAILDFRAGKDVGLGMAGGTSLLSGGVRVAQFTSGLTANINAIPDYQVYHSHNLFKAAMQAKHNFHGIGPVISWDASTPLAGNAQDGELTLTWGVNAALLFGRTVANVHHQTSKTHFVLFGERLGGYTTSTNIKRSHMATIPNLGGFAGLSMRYANAKIAFGYRADLFFDAMDGGIDVRQSQTLGFYGPFANLSIGIGG